MMAQSISSFHFVWLHRKKVEGIKGKWEVPVSWSFLAGFCHLSLPLSAGCWTHPQCKTWPFTHIHAPLSLLAPANCVQKVTANQGWCNEKNVFGLELTPPGFQSRLEHVPPRWVLQGHHSSLSLNFFTCKWGYITDLAKVTRWQLLHSRAWPAVFLKEAPSSCKVHSTTLHRHWWTPSSSMCRNRHWRKTHCHAVSNCNISMQHEI